MFPLPRKLFFSACPLWISSGAWLIQWPDPASHSWQEPSLRCYQQNFDVCWHCLTLIVLLWLPWKIFGTTFVTRSPVLVDVPTQFFYGIWACTLFPHSGSVLCRCPYKERIVRQTTTARTPSHRSVDDCCLALPPRLWQPHNPEGGEATAGFSYVIPRKREERWIWQIGKALFIKFTNLPHLFETQLLSCWTQIYPAFANIVDLDQLASGSALFIIKYVNLYQQSGSSNLIGWKLEMGVASYFIQQDKG